MMFYLRAGSFHGKPICHCLKLLENTGNSAMCVNLWEPGENSFCQQDNNPNHKVKLTLRVK